jgi:chromosome segregation ATPase
MECRKCYGAVAEMIEPKDDEIARLTQQLSDTQRQNAELQAERDEARRAFDAVSKMQDLSHKQAKELIAERDDLMQRVGKTETDNL